MADDFQFDDDSVPTPGMPRDDAPQPEDRAPWRQTRNRAPAMHIPIGLAVLAAVIVIGGIIWWQVDEYKERKQLEAYHQNRHEEWLEDLRIKESFKNPALTFDNVLRIRVGMTLGEIETIFGSHFPIKRIVDIEMFVIDENLIINWKSQPLTECGAVWVNEVDDKLLVVLSAPPNRGGTVVGVPVRRRC